VLLGLCVNVSDTPCVCSSSLLSSSECWLFPFVTVLALLRDSTPDPDRSITDGMAERERERVKNNQHWGPLFSKS